MGCRSLPLAISVVLVAGCGAGQVTPHPGTPQARPGTQAPAASAGQNPGGSSASDRVPGIIRAAVPGSASGPGILQPGAPVSAADIGPRAGATHDVVFGLADRGKLFGETYPAISTDAGKRWRIDGPRLTYAAALWGAKTGHRLLTCDYGCGGGAGAGSIAGL